MFFSKIFAVKLFPTLRTFYRDTVASYSWFGPIRNTVPVGGKLRYFYFFVQVR